jgi:RHS repeat-associated protein
MLISAGGAVTEYVRDEAGRPVLVKRPGAGVTEQGYDDRGQLRSVKTPFGHEVTLEWSADRRTLVERDTDGTLTEQELDELGRVTKLRDAMGAETRYEYDPAGYLSAMLHPDGTRRRFSRDPEGRITELVDEAGRSTRWSYDAAGRCTAVERPDGATVRSRYDSENHLLQVDGPAGERFAFHYSPRGLLRSVSLPDGRDVSFEHDPVGRPVKMTTAPGESTEVRRDVMGRIEQARYPDGSEKLAVHDPDGNWLRSEQDGHVIEREVAPEGLAVREQQDDFWLMREFGPAGEVRAVTDSFGHRASFAYDSRGRVVGLEVVSGRWEEGEWAATGPPHAHGFEYDRKGRLSRWTMPSGLVESRSYDVRGRLIDQKVVRGERVVLERRYQCDPTGRVVAIDDSRRGRAEYGLDAIGRLVSTRGRDRDARYVHDPAGPGGVQAGGTPVRGAAVRRDTQDLHGFVVRRAVPGGTQELSYTAQGLVREARLPDGRRASFAYDPHQRLLSRTLDGRVRRYFWNDERLWAVQDEGQPPVVLITLPGAWAPVEQLQADAYHTIHTDHVERVLDLVDSHGELAWSDTSGPWGEGRGPAAPGQVECPVAMAGQIRDDATGLHYNRYRFYDPECGRYLAPDPVGIWGGLELYGYVSDPVNVTDPRGLECRGKTDDSTLYRGDSRPPDQICQQGFQPVNPNGNVTVFEHVEGIHGSNWVSTTYDGEVAERFARSGVHSSKAPPNAEPWVYVIDNPGCGVEVDCDPEVQAKYGNPVDSEKEIAFNGGLPPGRVLGYYHADQGPASFQTCP